MATHQLGPIIAEQWVDKRRTGAAAISTDNVATDANFTSMASIDARLTAISATTFSAARLNTMTLNDKIYALRIADSGEIGGV